jgi:ribonuclease P protein component
MILGAAPKNDHRGGSPDTEISDETLRKDEHILKSKDYRAVYKKGRSFKRSGFVLSAAPNNLTYNRLGFSISSAIVKNAVTRNRIRRLFREFYRKNKGIFRKAFDIVVIVRKCPQRKFLHKEAAAVFVALARDAGILA